jgi:hypothetical protein
MVTKVHYRRFAKIAPDPQRPSQQVRIRFDPQDPRCAPILQMLEQSEHGELRRVIAQALRTAAATALGREPLAPPQSQPRRTLGGRRFTVVRSETPILATREDLFTRYDPREPWNAHLEAVLARCEWGETNKTMLQLLIDGLRSMGYTGTPNPAGQAAAAQPGAASPAGAGEPAAPSAPTPRPPRQPASVTIGVDPTQVQPRPTLPAVNNLIRGAGRRSDQG